MLFQITNLINAIVGGTVDFNDIKTASLYDRTASLALVAGFRSMTVRAVDRFGKKTCYRGFSAASRPGKKISVPHRAVFYRTGDHSDCGCLPYDI